MALILSLRNGNKFYVDDEEFICHSIEQEQTSISGHYCEFSITHKGVTHKVRFGELLELGGAVIRSAVRKRMKGRLASVSVEAEGHRVGRKPATACEACGGIKFISVQEVCGACKGHGCLSCGGKGLKTYRCVCPDCA